MSGPYRTPANPPQDTGNAPPAPWPPDWKWRDPLWHAYFVAALSGTSAREVDSKGSVERAETRADEAWRRHTASPPMPGLHNGVPK